MYFWRKSNLSCLTPYMKLTSSSGKIEVWKPLKKQKLTTKQEKVYEETFLHLLHPIFIFSYSTYFLPIYFSNLLTYLPLNLFLLPWVDLFIKTPPLNCCHYLAPFHDFSTSTSNYTPLEFILGVCPPMNENSLLPPHHKQCKRFTFQNSSSFHIHYYHT